MLGNYEPVRESVMRMVFDSYIEDTITDEQVQRVLGPVFRLIKEGVFDRPRRLFIAGMGRRRGLLNYGLEKVCDKRM